MHGCKAALATMAAALTLGTGVGAAAEGTPVSPGPTATSAQDASRVEKALLTEMNRVRTQRGRVALRPLATLTRAARGHSRTLLGSGAFQHDSLDGSPFWTRLVAAGFPATRRMGENLAMVSGCDRAAARETVSMWMASPGHRANLLNPRFRFVGPGAATVPGCSQTILTADYGG